jgi:phosphoglycolate phosphatase
MPRIRGVVFDLDGTLIDSVLDIAEAANHALTVSGYPTRSVAEIRGYVGDGARVLLARAAEKPSDDPELDALFERFLDYYTAHPIAHTELLPCVRDTLGALSRLPLALCTNKPRRTTTAVVNGLELATSFQVIVAGDDLPQKKPDPAPLRHIAQRLGAAPAELVMVGDGPQDVECARAAGARSIGVENGIAQRERLLAARPDALIPTLCALPDLLERWQEQG